MKSDNRWIYVGGVAVLVVLVLVGVFWPRDDEGGAADAGAPSRGDASGGDGAVASGDGAPVRGDAASGDEAVMVSSVSTMTPPPVDAGDDIGAVPSDPAECRAYCQDLADRGVLANGATAAGCASRLCPSDEEEEAGEEPPAERVGTISEIEVPELPDGCPEQCQALHANGELRPGMSVDDCIAAMCGSEEGEGAEDRND